MRVINAERLVRDIAVLGASAGGIAALTELLALLPETLPAAVCLVIPRAPWARNWSRMLGKGSKLPVSEPVNGERLERGRVYIAPADFHMTIHDGFLFLNRGHKQHALRPAVNPLFESAALAYGPRVVGVVLSGSGSDGTKAMRCIW